MSDIMLSILIPSIPSRVLMMKPLVEDLLQQIDREDAGDRVEVTVYIDNKHRTIGKKRETLVSMAQGKYLAFVDDDDVPHANYVKRLLEATNSDADVITFRQHYYINKEGPGEVVFGLGNPNESASKVNGQWSTIRRQPFHVCAWKSSIAKKYPFPDTNYGEDWGWCQHLVAEAKTEHFLDEVLHSYFYDDKVTEAK